MSTINDIDSSLIENFISGNLSPEEERKFRERLETDIKFSKAYDFRIRIAKYWSEAELYDTTKRHVKNHLNLEQKRNKKFLTFLYAAASVVILIGFTIIYTQKSKHGPSERILTDSKKDTFSSFISPFSTHVQPEKGKQYITTLEYTNHDTLIIKRTKDFRETEIIDIRSMVDNSMIGEYVLASGIDSLLIPLQGIQPGNYQWEIAGTSYSGKFLIKESPMIKK